MRGSFEYFEMQLCPETEGIEIGNCNCLIKCLPSLSVSLAQLILVNRY